MCFQANSIIKKLQGDVKALLGKMKVKNAVTVSQEKVLQETTDKLQQLQTQLQDAQQQLRQRDEEVCVCLFVCVCVCVCVFVSFCLLKHRL